MDEEKRNNIIASLPVPVLIVNSSGKVIAANERIDEVFLYDGIEGADVFALTGYKAEVLYRSVKSEERLIIERNERRFKITPYISDESEDPDLMLMFTDVTIFENLKERYNAEKPCALKVEIDNYEELINPTGTAPNLSLANEIDKIIRNWALGFNGSIIKIEDSIYITWFEQKYLDSLIEKNFDVMDQVRALETGLDFPASISIGVGVAGKDLPETESFAESALELARGRGGDQAVVKKKAKTDFYGGKLLAIEKSNKRKSRIVGHVLKQLIDQSKNVFIMGHRYADMDSFGASLGIARLVTVFGKQAYVVIDEVGESLEEIYEQAKKTDDYEIISSKRAVDIAESDSLLVIVDTHRSTLMQTPEMLHIVDKVAIIDHHRKAEDVIEDATLSYIESYASSASEMVTEIIQFMTQKKVLLKEESEALLAGITVDTNSFAMKTGVRTFEAAAWLRRQGADPTAVKRYLQEELDIVKIRAEVILRAERIEPGIMISTIDWTMDDSQVICAKLADELLAIKGVKASFVIGKNRTHTVVSARSLGEINVQTIMEKFGGGGHLSVAAAQVNETIEETKCKILEILEAK